MPQVWNQIAQQSASVSFTSVSVGNNQQITAQPTTTFLSGSFTGSFTGDGSKLTGIVASGSVTNAISASYSATASYAYYSVTASYVSGSINTSIFPYTGSAIITGSLQIIGNIIGYNSSSYIGNLAGAGTTQATSSIYLGEQAGYNAASSSYSTFVGPFAGLNASNSLAITAIGYQAGISMSNANNSTALGASSGYSANNAIGSLFLGLYAGAAAISSSYSTFLGPYAGWKVSGSSYSTFIGYNAGFNSTLGNNNILIGTNVTLASGSSNSINFGGLIFGSGSYNNTGSVSSGSANGFVGINQPNPQYGLDVNGTARISNNTQITGSVIVSGSIVVTAPGTAAAVSVTGGTGTISLLSNAGFGNPGIQSSGVIHMTAPINGTGGSEVLAIRKSSSGTNIVNFQANSGATLSTITGNGSLGLNKTFANAILDVSGSAIITGSLVLNQITAFATNTPILNLIGNVSASSALAQGAYLTPTLIASASNDFLVGLDINPMFNIGAFTGVTNLALRVQSGVSSFGGNIALNGNSLHLGSNNGNTVLRNGGNNTQLFNNNSGGILYLNAAGSIDFGSNTPASSTWARFFNTGNLLIQTGGTFTDAGYKLDVNGSTRITAGLTITGSLLVSGSTTQIGNNILTGNNSLTGSNSMSGSNYQIGNNTITGNTLMSGSLTISGSQGIYPYNLNIYGDTSHNGNLQFLPVSANINNSVSASYIYVSGSTSDLYFTQNGNGYQNTTRLRWMESNLYTGILSGGIISSTPGSTTFNVSSGSGIIVSLNASTSSADPFPTVQRVSWGPILNQPIINSGSAKITYLSMTSAGTVNQQIVPIGSTDVSQWDTQIELGLVLHLSGSVSTGVYNAPQVSYGFAQQTDDFLRAFGPLKTSGHTLSPSGSSPTLRIIKTGGTAYNKGANYVNNPNHPSTVIDSAITTSKIYRYYISGSTPVIDSGVGGAGYTDIDNKNYVDTATGNLATVGASNWSIQRVFWIPNSPTNAFLVYYGNARYGTLVNAINAKDSEVFIEAPNTAANAIFLGYIIIQGGGTGTPARDLNDPTETTIIPGGLFRSVGGVGSSGTAPVSNTLAGLSDVTVPSRTSGDLLYYNGSQWTNAKTLTGTYGITGALSVSSGITADLTGTASYASTASYIANAQTASYIVTAQTASFAQTASYVNPLKQNVQITGSVNITGSLGLNGVPIPTGTGAINQIAYWTGSNAQTGSSSFTWDDTNKYLSIGVGLAGYARFAQSGWADGFTQSAYGNFLFSVNLRYNGSAFIYDKTGYGAIVQTDGNSGDVSILTSVSGTAAATATTNVRFRVLNAGRTLLGPTLPTDDTTSALQVNGAGRFTGNVIITGSLIVNSSINASSFTGSFTGSYIGALIGTASYATTAISSSYALTTTSASYALVATSASYALTASNVQGGTANYLPLWNTNTTLTSSGVYQDANSNIGINTTTPFAKLHVQSTPTFNSNGGYASYINNLYTVPASSTFNNGGFWGAYYATDSAIWSGSSTINNGAILAGGIAVNLNQFGAASSTITLSPNGSNIRAIAAMQILQQTGGTINGTISHGAGVFIQGIYPTNTANVTFTNYYGLLINKLDEWGGITLTNRYAIYQAGASDQNYFAGAITAAGGITGSITSAVTASYANTATNITATSNSTLTTLSVLSLPYSQLTGAPSLAGYVTSVTGTTPIVSSGGTTPAISIPAATTSINGYLTSTDWNTFNGKQAALSGTGFVKSTAGTISYDTSTYLTGNQTITLSGDVSGTGATAITTTIGALKVTNGMLAGSINYSKMDATTVPTWNQNTTGTASNITAYTINQSVGSSNAPTFTSLYLNAGYLYFNDTDRDASSSTYYPNAWTRGTRFSFANASSTGTGGNYAGVLHFHPWDGTTSSTGDASYQLAFGSTATNGGGYPQLRIRKGIDTTWNTWYDILTAANYNSYALPLSGGTLTGALVINGTGNRPVTIDSGISIKGESGGWAVQYGFTGSSGTARGGFGALGSTDALTYFYVGTYASEKLKIDYSTGAATFSSSVAAVTATITPNTTGVSTGLTVVNGDITTYRTGGTTGVIYLSSSGTRYLYWDATNYIMPGGQLDVNGYRVLNAGNYTSYSPTLTGGSASGTWGISITGNAATAYGWANTPDTWYGIGQTTSASGATAVGGYYPWVLSYHTGLAFSAHSAYGGLRFYNQNYPTGPLASTPVLQIINYGLQVNGDIAMNSYNISGATTITATTFSGALSGNATTATTAGSAPNGSNINNYYNSTAGSGYGFRFWNGSDVYKIHMGTGAEYQYGPVTDYSIKCNMDSNGSTRGFTWGQNGATPIAALNVGNGNMQIVGSFKCGDLYTTGQIQNDSLAGSGVRNVNATAAGELTVSTSDVTLKKNVENATYGLDVVMALRPVTYNWIPEDKLGTQKELGFIAQEVQELIPEVIGTNYDGKLSLDYAKIVAVLTKAIQDQQAQIEELKNIINSK